MGTRPWSHHRRLRRVRHLLLPSARTRALVPPAPGVGAPPPAPAPGPRPRRSEQSTEQNRAAFDEYWNAQLEKVNIDDAVRGSPAWRATEDLLASVPGIGRTSARTLIADLPELLGPDDVLLVNDTRVIPARLHLRNEDEERYDYEQTALAEKIAHRASADVLDEFVANPPEGLDGETIAVIHGTVARQSHDAEEMPDPEKHNRRNDAFIKLYLDVLAAQRAARRYPAPPCSHSPSPRSSPRPKTAVSATPARRSPA